MRVHQDSGAAGIKAVGTVYGGDTTLCTRATQAPRSAGTPVSCLEQDNTYPNEEEINSWASLPHVNSNQSLLSQIEHDRNNDTQGVQFSSVE